MFEKVILYHLAFGSSAGKKLVRCLLLLNLFNQPVGLVFRCGSTLDFDVVLVSVTLIQLKLDDGSCLLMM